MRLRGSHAKFYAHARGTQYLQPVRQSPYQFIATGGKGSLLGS
jgi:hypothetical protein